MKILFPYMARWKAVNWTRYHQILTRLAEDGHHIYVLQPPQASIGETNFDEIEIEIPDTIHLIEIPVSSLLWNRKFFMEKLFKKGYYSFISTKMIRQMIELHNIDVLLLYNIPQYPYLQFRKVIRVFDFADDYLAMLKHEMGRFANPIVGAMGEFILHRMIKKSDVTFAVSQVLADHYKDYPIHVLPNGVDLKKYKCGIGRELKKDFKQPVIGFIGSFEYFIDFDLIIESAKSFPDYTFLMVGGGRRLNEVKEKVNQAGLQNFVFTGGVSHARVMQYIDVMDICLNIFTKEPISHAACPIKLFEYLALEKPVISTRITEVLNMDNGTLYFADTVSEVIRSINDIFNHPDDTAARIKRGRQMVEEKYNWDKITSEFLHILNSNHQKR